MLFVISHPELLFSFVIWEMNIRLYIKLIIIRACLSVGCVKFIVMQCLDIGEWQVTDTISFLNVR